MNRLRSCVFLLIVLCMLVISSAAFPAVIYVKWNSPGGIGSPPVFDGRSWDSAYHTVQAGINAASAGDEVWVARGTYVERITLKDRVPVYGGFYGIETSRNSRNWLSNQTILDGSQQGSVVSCVGMSDFVITFVLDGFTVQNGKATNGGGIYCDKAHATIANCLIKGNTATTDGGGIYCSLSTVTIYNNRILGNSAFLNYMNRGGGILTAATDGVVANNTIVGNNAQVGGGMFIGLGNILIANNIVAFCSSGICRDGSTAYYLSVFHNNCSYGNKTDNFLGQVSAGSNGNVSVDPRFASYEYGNVHIQADSPCIDAGDDTAVGSGWLDIDRQARIQGAHVDIGADESTGVTWTAGPYTIVRVRPDGDDANDGSSWSEAKRTIQAAANVAADKGGDVWVKAGTYAERIKLPALVHVYGGFAGTEMSRDERAAFPRAAPDANESVLDGSAGGTVVVAQSGNKCSRIDGFTIRNGKTTGASGTGGGILCAGASPIIANNRITQNAAGAGGGIYVHSCSPEILNNVIADNTAETAGGGINAYCYAAPTIRDNTITGNTAPQGGSGVNFQACKIAVVSGNTISGNSNIGISIKGNSPVIMEGNTITGNTGSGILCDASYALIQCNTITGNINNASGAPYGGGIFCSGSAQATITRNTISGNKAYLGSGICCTGSGCRPMISGNVIADNGGADYESIGGGICSWQNAAPRITGNTIVGNITSSSGLCPGGGIYFESCPSQIAGNIIAFNSSGIERSGNWALPQAYRDNCVYGNTSAAWDYIGIPTGDDISADPLFIDRASGDYHLTAGSPAIDRGSTYDSSGLDLDGQGRTFGSAMDIGADEYWSAIMSVSDVKKAINGALANGSSAAVTAVFPGFFYIEAADRSIGIRVNGTHPDLAVGVAADIEGKMATSADGERCIEMASVSVSPGTAVAPIGMNIGRLGGSNWCYTQFYSPGQQGITGASGLNNIGLLVKVWGKITHSGDGWFYLDDGSGVQDGSGFAGVKVLAYGLTIPAEGQYAQVTGVSSCCKSGANLLRLIRATEVAAP